MNRSQRSSAQCSDYRQKRWHKSIKLAKRLDLNYSHHKKRKNNDKYVIAHQALLFMEFSRQEYWSGQPFPSPGHLPDPGIKPRSLTLQAGSLPSEPRGKPLIEVTKVRLFATPWTVAYQAPPSVGFDRQEYWSGLPFPSPRDLPDPGIKPRCPAS